MIPEGFKEYFDYLERLRRSGVVNMFGSAPYLAEEFELSMRDARDVVTAWMKNYDPKDYEEL